jgi:hypothetical protein
VATGVGLAGRDFGTLSGAYLRVMLAQNSANSATSSGGLV